MPIQGLDLQVRSIKTETEKRNELSSCRCRSRELSRNSSFEVYYGDSPVGVPFRWESRPGTPRVKSRETLLPPLTPPPSYLSSPANRNNVKKPRKGSNLLHTVLPKLKVKRQSPPASSSPSSSSSSSSSPWSYSSAPGSPCALNSNFQGPRPSLDSRLDDDSDTYESSVLSPCFCIGRSAKARSRGFTSNMVKLLFGGEFA